MHHCHKAKLGIEKSHYDYSKITADMRDMGVQFTESPSGGFFKRYFLGLHIAVKVVTCDLTPLQCQGREGKFVVVQ